MIRIESFLERSRKAVEQTLDSLIPFECVGPRSLHEAIRWSIFAGGKRIRPALVFASGGAFGASQMSLARTAAAIEMIHTYSLIHDDLPSMDNDDLRRGRPTCHVQFSEATAILAGDALQTLAFKTIADDESLDHELRIRLISLIAGASGTPSGMVSGQQLDLEAEGRSLNASEMEMIHAQKTGALITAAACSGAMIGGANEVELSSIRDFGKSLGLLFQITDDILDITQETATLGKTAGKDAAARKATYPGLFGIERANELAADALDEAHTKLDELYRDAHLLHQLADMIASRTR